MKFYAIAFFVVDSYTLSSVSLSGSLLALIVSTLFFYLTSLAMSRIFEYLLAICEIDMCVSALASGCMA
jgi:hypothetical protein